MFVAGIVLFVTEGVLYCLLYGILEGCSDMVELVVVVFPVCCWLSCMVLQYLVSNGSDCSRVDVLGGVADMNMLV